MEKHVNADGGSTAIGGVYLFLELLTEAAGDKTMGVQQVQLLLALHSYGVLNQVDLPRYTGVEKSSNSRHIAALGAGFPVLDKKTGTRSIERGLGWVEAYEEPTNRRFKMVRLTPLGKAQLDSIAARVAAQLFK